MVMGGGRSSVSAARETGLDARVRTCSTDVGGLVA